MDYNQKKANAKESIKNWIHQREIIDYSREVIEKNNDKYAKIAKQFGLTKEAKQLGL